jgi:uncharacterized membrane protein
MKTTRVEAFSDGVFAIAATLLVLGLRVPGTGQSLGEGLAQQWPSEAAYAVSFATIGIIWVNHHSLFSQLREGDRALLFVNLLLLMVVAFIPFPTDLLATYLRVGGTDSRIAAAIYGMTMSLAACCFTIIWWRIGRRRDLLASGTTSHHVRASLRRSLKGPIIYAVATGVAALSAPAALVGYAAVAVYFILPGRNLAPATNRPEFAESGADS